MPGCAQPSRVLCQGPWPLWPSRWWAPSHTKRQGLWGRSHAGCWLLHWREFLSHPGTVVSRPVLPQVLRKYRNLNHYLKTKNKKTVFLSTPKTTMVSKYRENFHRIQQQVHGTLIGSRPYRNKIISIATLMILQKTVSCTPTNVGSKQIYHMTEFSWHPDTDISHLILQWRKGNTDSHIEDIG